MAKVAGTCYFKVDGEQLEVSGGVEVPLLDVKRETVMGSNGPAGYKETALRPYIKLKAVVNAEFPLAMLQSATEMTATAELANGMVYTLSGAFVEGEPAINNDDGTIDIEFGGKKGIFQ